MAVLKREYEISVWHEKLNEKGNKLEEKMAVIGAHDMTYLGRATNVHFLTKMNGTHLLTFLLPDKYFDSEKGDFVLNEFKDYLLNESKVKLKYKDEWYEFYIKTVKDTKHYKSYMKNYTCTDAYIDELSRNGYGITFDTELYNNVEEIGIFTDEILDGSLWEYSPENNWGDFTEYTEEKLFKIPVSLFGGTVSGYKLNFDINSNLTINNVYTKEKRGLLLGDDLAASTEENDGYFWDCQNLSHNVSWDSVDNIPNDGYIYVPYSQLDFCYETNKYTPSGNFIPATEAPHYGTISGVSSYFLAPPSINPKSLIQFITIPSGAPVEVDEAGLIVNKNYTYVMTVENWNNANNSKYWYTKDKEGDHNGDFKKEVTENYRPASQSWFYNRCVTYDGYLDSLGGLEVENGKRISISDRTEINISEDIDLYVKVYKDTSENFSSLYTDPDDWKTINGTGLSGHRGYRVCSATRTRLIMPQLARNYFENAVNIKSVNGWEPMHIDNLGALSQKKNTEVSFLYEKNNDTVLVGKIKVHTSDMDKNDNTYYSIVNFGAVGQKKTILKGKTYCFGIKFKQNYGAKLGNYFKVGKGSMTDNGDYKIYGEELITQNPPIISIPLSTSLTLYYLVNSHCEIENPYLVLQFLKDLEVIIEEAWFFEAYTCGLDFFEDGYFKYSGRDYLWPYEEKYKSISESVLKKRILFETDVMDGDTYAYLEYFILQLVPKGLNYGIDTFKAKEYISEKVKSNSHPTSLPLSAADYTDDDYTIVTNYIDLNKCPHYVLNSSTTSCDCKYSSSTPDKFCMYQKYGYCPYMFTTEKHCRKIRTLSGSKSNRFNLTLELGKVFEVYPQYYIEHTSNGNVKTDENGKAIKKVFYITEKGLENKIGYRYEKNLANIDRTIVSDKIVTKLYVLDVDSELSRTGLCSIKTAEDNPSKDSFIIDLSYYIKQGMLDKEQTIADLYGNDNTKLGFLKQLGHYNEQYDMLTNKIINMQNESYNDLLSKVEVDITGYETVLLEIYKLKKLMSKYTMDPEHPLTTDNKTFESYLDKYDLQESRKKSILKELLGLTETSLTPQDLQEKYKNKEAISGVTQGLYAQFIKEYNTILDWKKERAKYLNDINNLTKEFYSIYEPYLKEGTWSNNNYLTDNAYYHDALDVAAEGAIPKVTYSIKVVPLGILDDTYEVGIADTTYIEDIGMFGINKKTGLPNRLKVIISELNENLDKPSEDSITILNFTTQFEDLFQQVTASVLSLTYNENIYKRSSNFTSNLNVKTESLLGTLDGNDLVLLNTSEENIKLDSKGLTGSDINNHNNWYKLDGQGLFFSNNGGQSWKSGVGPDGINADYINTGTLDAGNIRIVDNDYLYFLWDSTGITAYKDPAVLDNDLIFGQDFARFNRYGLSLVEENKIRLRAGYRFTGSDGDINTEDVVGKQIGFYLYDTNGNAIFYTLTETSKSARLSLAGEILASRELHGASEEEQSEISDENMGVFIFNQANNKAIYKKRSGSDKKYYLRLFNITLQKKDSSDNPVLNNIISVMADGGLYIGGTIELFNPDALADIEQLDNYIRIKDDTATEKANIIELIDGKIYLGGENLKDAVLRLIDELAEEVQNYGVPWHKHNILSTDIEPKDDASFIKTFRMNFLLDVDDPNYSSDNADDTPNGKKMSGPLSIVSTGMSMEQVNFGPNYRNNLWIAISSRPMVTKGENPTLNTSAVRVDWIKLSDFLDHIMTKPFETEGYGDGGGGGGGGDIYDAGYYLPDPISLV